MRTVGVSAIGQDSHRFGPEGGPDARPLVLAGVRVPGAPGLLGNSDADVVLHAVTNAVSGLTGVNVLGAVADRLCLEQGVTDSAAYLAEALCHLGGLRLTHLSVSIEAARPKLAPHVPALRANLARLLGLPVEAVGLTATSGEGLTAFGRGEGIQALCILSAERTED